MTPFAARLRELSRAASAGPWDADRHGDIYDNDGNLSVEAPCPGDAPLITTLRNAADRLADYIDAGEALATALDRHIASLAGQFADVDLAVDAFRDRLAALERPAP